MSRLDRLYALAERLRRPAGATVPQLARELGVTPRTIHRDLALLREKGLDVQGEPGRGGGLRVRSRWEAPPLGLTLGESLRLAVAHRMASALGALPPGATLDLLLAKLAGGLPPDAGRRLQTLLSRVVIGLPASPAVQETLSAVPADRYSLCEQAFMEARSLRLGYRDAAGQVSQRRVQPHGLLVQVPAWYLLAWDEFRAAPRTFRLDRILEVEVLWGCPFQPGDPRRMFEEIRLHDLEASC